MIRSFIQGQSHMLVIAPIRSFSVTCRHQLSRSRLGISRCCHGRSDHVLTEQRHACHGAISKVRNEGVSLVRTIGGMCLRHLNPRDLHQDSIRNHAIIGVTSGQTAPTAVGQPIRLQKRGIVDEDEGEYSIITTSEGVFP